MMNITSTGYLIHHCYYSILLCIVPSVQAADPYWAVIRWPGVAAMILFPGNYMWGIAYCRLAVRDTFFLLSSHLQINTSTGGQICKLNLPSFYPTSSNLTSAWPSQPLYDTLLQHCQFLCSWVSFSVLLLFLYIQFLICQFLSSLLFFFFPIYSFKDIFVINYIHHPYSSSLFKFILDIN